MPSDQHAGDGHSLDDLYLFAFLSGLIAASQEDVKKVIEAGQPHYLMHAMPENWTRPAQWNPLGKLAVKSESEQTQVIEIGGQDEGRDAFSASGSSTTYTPRNSRRILSLSYLHSQSLPEARLGIHSPTRKETYIIGGLDWGNIWVYGMDVLLAGYLTREEFSRRASFIQAGARVFQYDRTRTKNLAVSVSDLKPLSDLMAHVKDWNR